MELDALAVYFNVDRGALLAPLAILASSILGASVALWAIFSNRHMSRLKNSMDFIASYNEDEDITAAIREVTKLEDSSSNDVQQLATDPHRDQARHIRTVLNYYEAMSVCINRKIYSEKIIKETLYTSMTDMWRICRPYVDERRRQKKRNTYYQELQGIAERWEKKPLKEKRAPGSNSL